MNPFPIDELKARKEYLEERYSFSNDKDFASKLKSYYSNNEYYRRTGRTFLMVRILIETSIERNMPVNIVDHFEIDNNNQRLLHHVHSMINEVIHWYGYHGIMIKTISRQPNNFEFHIVDGHYLYNSIRIDTINPFIKKKEFSKKLLLII